MTEPLTISLGNRLHEIDLDRLTPLAASIAEAIATTDPIRGPRPMLMDSTATSRELLDDLATRRPEYAAQIRERWYTEEQLDQPDRITYESWAVYPTHSTMDAHAWLENEARKVPIGYVPVGKAGDGLLSSRQVLALIKEKEGRDISPSTWSGYVSRGFAPEPVRYVQRKPLWDHGEVSAWLEDRSRSKRVRR